VGGVRLRHPGGWSRGVEWVVSGYCPSAARIARPIWWRFGSRSRGCGVPLVAAAITGDPALGRSVTGDRHPAAAAGGLATGSVALARGRHIRPVDRLFGGHGRPLRPPGGSVAVRPDRRARLAPGGIRLVVGIVKRRAWLGCSGPSVWQRPFGDPVPLPLPEGHGSWPVGGTEHRHTGRPSSRPSAECAGSPRPGGARRQP
jgi:hypothetical protein